MQSARLLQDVDAGSWDSGSVGPFAQAGRDVDLEGSHCARPSALRKKLTISTFDGSDLQSDGGESGDTEAEEAEEEEEAEEAEEEEEAETQEEEEEEDEEEAEEEGEAEETLATQGEHSRSSAEKPLPEDCPSVGSVPHGSGFCKPCGFFWKSTGCGHGRECLYCHLCPPGELKARKKVKRTRAILDVCRQVDSWAQSRQEPQKVTVLSSCYPESLREPAAALGLTADPLAAAAAAFGREPAADLCEPCAPLGASVAPGSPLPSIGSALHASNRCKPCIWFWKPQGCENGRDCLHCHLCNSVEAKHRKLLARMRRAGASSHKAALQRPSDALLAEQQPPPAPPARPAARGLPPQQVPPVPPSLGSSAHGTGCCKPCRWFWRPQGCANGRDCQHCHLCPMNEAKERKRLKRATPRVDLPAPSCYAEEAFARAAAWLPPPPGL